jgi:hypothetical protein
MCLSGVANKPKCVWTGSRINRNMSEWSQFRPISVYSRLRSDTFRFIRASAQTYFGLFVTPLRQISVYSWLRSDRFRFIRDSAQTDFGLLVTPLRHISVYSWLRSNRFRFICDSVQTYFGLFVTPIRQISVYSWLRSDRFRFIREYVQTDFTVYWFLRCIIKHQILLRKHWWQDKSKMNVLILSDNLNMQPRKQRTGNKTTVTPESLRLTINVNWFLNNIWCLIIHRKNQYTVKSVWTYSRINRNLSEVDIFFHSIYLHLQV